MKKDAIATIRVTGIAPPAKNQRTDRIQNQVRICYNPGQKCWDTEHLQALT